MLLLVTVLYQEDLLPKLEIWSRYDFFFAFVQFLPSSSSEILFSMNKYKDRNRLQTQLTIICSKSTIETVEKDVKYVQS